MRAILLGTGPSVTDEVIAQLHKTDLPIFGCNNAYQWAPLTALYSNNKEWWDYYWPRDIALREGKFDKWTYDRETSNKYGIKFIRGVWEPGLSKDPDLLHWGHGSGYELLGIAYHYGVREFVLIGYDLRYPKGYQRDSKEPGGKRHRFGEYPKELQHWPRVGPDGEMTGLLECYRTIDTKDLRIINCSPGSALDFFEMGNFLDET